jgi:hypothetical protein
LAVVVAPAAPLRITVAPLPPVAGVIDPEMVYVSGVGDGEVLRPLTTPEQPQASIAGRSVATHNRARLARETRIDEWAGTLGKYLSSSTLIVQTFNVSAGRKSTVKPILLILDRRPI